MKTLFPICLLLFLAGSCKKYEPFKERIEDDFTLVITDSTGVTNDGVSTIKLSITNVKQVKEGLKATFITNKGSILVNDLKYENNKAETILKLGSDTGLYIIKAQIKDGDIVKIEKIIFATFREEFLRDDFILSVSDSSNVRADGRAIIKINFSNPNYTNNILKVTFQSNKGSFLSNDIIYENKRAETFLKVDQDTGIYFIKALLKNGTETKVEKTISFTFRPAYPDSIALELSRTLYSLSAPIKISTFLFRNTGLVTKGTSVLFKAFQTSGLNDTVQVGRFEGLYNNYSDVDGKLTDMNLFTDGPLIDTNKAIIIQAKTFNDLFQPVQKEISINHH